MGSTSSLLLLLSFSSLCLLTGVLLLDEGGALSTWGGWAHRTSSFVSDDSSSAVLSLPSPLLLSSPPASLHSSSFSLSSSPLSLLTDYQTTSSVAVKGSPSPLSTCDASLHFLSSSPLPPLTSHHLLAVMDHPQLNPSLSWDTGHALLQFFAALHLSLTCGLSLVGSTVFPFRPHWDAFIGVLAGERKEVELSMAFEGLRGFTLRQLTVDKAEEELRRLTGNGGSALLIRLEETQLRLTEEGPVWLNDSRLMEAVSRQYCIARNYRPVPVDLFAAQRLQRPSPVIVAVHVECDRQHCSEEERRRYVGELTSQVTAVREGVNSSHVSVHAFADQSALSQREESDDGSRMALAELSQRLWEEHRLTVIPHPSYPAMWALHHYITADLFIGNIKGSLHPFTPSPLSHLHSLCPPCQCIHSPPLLCCRVSPSLFAAVVRSPSLTFLPSSLHLPHVLPLSSLAPPSPPSTTSASLPQHSFSASLHNRRPAYRALSDCMGGSATRGTQGNTTEEGKAGQREERKGGGRE